MNKLRMAVTAISGLSLYVYTNFAMKTASAQTDDDYNKALAARHKKKQESCGACTDNVSILGQYSKVSSLLAPTKSDPREFYYVNADSNSAVRDDDEAIPEDKRVKVYINKDGTVSPQFCPPRYTKLAHGTWNYLHAMAAYYPSDPSPDLVSDMDVFIKVFARTYPCSTCKDHMQEYLVDHPIDATSTEALSLWVCGLHNDVNRVLGKPTVSCDFDYLMARYKEGFDDGSCD